MATLVENAKFGTLRVFCASHHPLFLGPLSGHKNLQIAELVPKYHSIAKRAIMLDAAGLQQVAGDITVLVHKANDQRERAAPAKAIKRERTPSTRPRRRAPADLTRT